MESGRSPCTRRRAELRPSVNQRHRRRWRRRHSGVPQDNAACQLPNDAPLRVFPWPFLHRKQCRGRYPSRLLSPRSTLCHDVITWAGPIPSSQQTQPKRCHYSRIRLETLRCLVSEPRDFSSCASVYASSRTTSKAGRPRPDSVDGFNLEGRRAAWWQ